MQTIAILNPWTMIANGVFSSFWGPSGGKMVINKFYAMHLSNQSLIISL